MSLLVLVTRKEAKQALHNAEVDVLRWSDEEPDAIAAAQERVIYWMAALGLDPIADVDV